LKSKTYSTSTTEFLQHLDSTDMTYRLKTQMVPEGVIDFGEWLLEEGISKDRFQRTIAWEGFI